MGMEFKAKGGSYALLTCLLSLTLNTANLALGPTVGPMGRVALGGRNWEAFSVDRM